MIFVIYKSCKENNKKWYVPYIATDHLYNYETAKPYVIAMHANTTGWVAAV